MVDALERELGAELRRMVRLPCLGGPRGPLARRPPHLKLLPRLRPPRVVGRADYEGHAVELVLSPTTSSRELLATLGHELVHLAGYERHDRRFKRAMTELAYEAWGLDVFASVRRPYTEVDLMIEDSLALRVRGAALWGRVVLRGLGWS